MGNILEPDVRYKIINSFACCRIVWVRGQSCCSSHSSCGSLLHSREWNRIASWANSIWYLRHICKIDRSALFYRILLVLGHFLPNPYILILFITAPSLRRDMINIWQFSSPSPPPSPFQSSIGPIRAEQSINHKS